MKKPVRKSSRFEYASKDDVIEYLERVADQLADRLVANKDNERALFDRQKVEETIEIIKVQP